MDQLTQVVISLADSMKPSTPTSSPGTPEDQPTVCWDWGGKSLSKELKSFVKSLQTQESWMIVQARRKREREDLMSQNPGFDPCFMKVWNLRPRVVGQSAALVLIVTTECWIHTEYNMIIISKLKARASRDCSRSGKKWLNNIHTDISILLNINNPSWKTQKYIPLCFIKNRFTFLYHLIPP